MTTTRLTEAWIVALRPRRTTIDIRDTGLKGFGFLKAGRQRYVPPWTRTVPFIHPFADRSQSCRFHLPTRPP